LVVVTDLLYRLIRTFLGARQSFLVNAVFPVYFVLLLFQLSTWSVPSGFPSRRLLRHPAPPLVGLLLVPQFQVIFQNQFGSPKKVEDFPLPGTRQDHANCESEQAEHAKGRSG